MRIKHAYMKYSLIKCAGKMAWHEYKEISLNNIMNIKKIFFVLKKLFKNIKTIKNDLKHYFSICKYISYSFIFNKEYRINQD